MDARRRLEIGPPCISRLRHDRVPGTLAEAQSMVAYNEAIIANTRSAARKRRAEAMLANLRPHIARLTYVVTPAVLARVTSAADDELVTVWNGEMGRAGASLVSSGMGSSLARAPLNRLIQP